MAAFFGPHPVSELMTPESLDNLDALLARYVAGGLPVPAQILVESHLAIKPASRIFASGLETLAGDALVSAPPTDLDGKQSRLEAILASEPPLTASPAAATYGIFPKPLRDLLGFDLPDVPWRKKLPGFKVHELGEIDGCQASLFWLRPGRTIPEHTHEGSELFLVLDGAFNDGIGRYARGDVSIADETVDHRPVAETERPCIGFAVTDGSLRLTGPLHRRLSDIIGF
jgi:putative transcriptional regulator